MSDFIPNKTVLVDDRAILEYKQIKKCNPREKNKKHLKPNNQATLQAFSQIQERVRLAIEYSKKKKYENIWNKLSNDKLNRKLYWAILKRFLTVKKIRCIPPLLYEGKFVTDFQVKSEVFNSHFDLHF